MAAGFDLRRHQQQTQISCATKTVFNCFKAPRANDEPHCPRAEHATTKSPQEYGRGRALVVGTKTPPTKSHRPRHRWVRQACRKRGVIFH